jgi:hypothetical protein
MKNLIEKYVGKGATIRVKNFKFEVLINDVRTSYGKEQFLVSPMSGSGESWVEEIELLANNK